MVTPWSFLNCVTCFSTGLFGGQLSGSKKLHWILIFIFCRIKRCMIGLALVEVILAFEIQLQSSVLEDLILIFHSSVVFYVVKAIS